MREEIKNWWEQAKHDLIVAEHNLKGEMLDAASFYCQQSVEKALKAYILFSKKESPGPIHSLIKLARIAEVPIKFHNFLKQLSPEYYISRYPDAIEDIPYKLYNKEDVKKIVENTKELFKWLNTQMKE